MQLHGHLRVAKIRLVHLCVVYILLGHLREHLCVVYILPGHLREHLRIVYIHLVHLRIINIHLVHLRVVFHIVCCQLEPQVAHARNVSCIVEQCISFVNANLSSNLESPVGNARNES